MDDLFPAPSSRKARIEIIPLIDVVFFLLATFVLFTLSLDKIGSISIPLPKAGEPLDREDLTIYLRAAEHDLYSWKQGRDGAAEQVTRAELPARLASYRSSVAHPRVMVSGDDRSRFSATVAALDAVRLARIAEVSVETR